MTRGEQVLHFAPSFNPRTGLRETLQNPPEELWLKANQLPVLFPYCFPQTNPLFPENLWKFNNPKGYPPKNRLWINPHQWLHQWLLVLNKLISHPCDFGLWIRIPLQVPRDRVTVTSAELQSRPSGSPAVTTSVLGNMDWSRHWIIGSLGCCFLMILFFRNRHFWEPKTLHIAFEWPRGIHFWGKPLKLRWSLDFGCGDSKSWGRSCVLGGRLLRGMWKFLSVTRHRRLRMVVATLRTWQQKEHIIVSKAWWAPNPSKGMLSVGKPTTVAPYRSFVDTANGVCKKQSMLFFLGRSFSGAGCALDCHRHLYSVVLLR